MITLDFFLPVNMTQFCQEYIPLGSAFYVNTKCKTRKVFVCLLFCLFLGSHALVRIRQHSSVSEFNFCLMEQKQFFLCILDTY